MHKGNTDSHSQSVFEWANIAVCCLDADMSQFTG